MMPTNIDQGRYNDSPKSKTYDVDLVLCIDGTRSMSPIIEQTKKNVLNLPDDILREATAQSKKIDNLRVRIVVFRDYLSDDEYAMQTTPFFDLPQEKEYLHEIVSEIIASGGGDEPEDALEGLAYAMLSDWQEERSSILRRQIIAVWTDASAHDLGFGKTSEYYDPMLPKSFDELTDWWGDDEGPDCKMDYNAKRLALFAPNVKPWNVLSNSWDNVILYPSTAGKGLAERNYLQIVQLLVKTLS